MERFVVLTPCEVQIVSSLKFFIICVAIEPLKYKLLVILKCPEDPTKTNIVLIAHANPGGNVPQWAQRSAVGALAPIEPFKLFNKINEHVKKNQLQLRERLKEAEMVSTLPSNRSPRPAGIAQLGYACFWPNGGGLKEGNFAVKTSDSSQTSDEHSQDAEGVANHSENDEGNMENVAKSSTSYEVVEGSL